MLGIEAEIAEFFDDEGRRQDKSDDDWLALKRRHDLSANARLDASRKVFTWKGKKPASLGDLLTLPSETDEDDSASVGQDARSISLSEHTKVFATEPRPTPNVVAFLYMWPKTSPSRPTCTTLANGTGVSRVCSRKPPSGTKRDTLNP